MRAEQPSQPLSGSLTAASATAGVSAARFAAVVACGLSIWLVAFMLITPVEYDEAVFGIVATGLLDGQWPYRDLFDHKPPLIYAWYLPYAVTQSVLVQRLFALALVMASLGVLATIARAWLPIRQSRLAIVSYAGLLANPFLGVGTSIETFMLLPIVSAIAAPAPILAGGLLGVAVMTKPTAIFFAPMLIARWRWSSWRCALGAAAVVTVSTAAFLPIASDFWNANVTFNREFSAAQWERLHGWERAGRLFAIQPQAMLGALPFWVAACAGLMTLRGSARSIGLWLVCAAVAVKANAFGGGEEWAHYHTLLLPPVALIAAVGLDHTLARRTYRWAYGAAAVVSVALIAIAATSVVRNDERDGIVAAIRATDGEVFSIAAPPQLYVEAGRQPQRRFFYANPLLIRGDWREATRLDVLACRPAALVIDARPHPDLDWHAEVAPLYATRREFGGLVLYTQPVRPCEQASR